MDENPLQDLNVSALATSATPSSSVKSVFSRLGSSAKRKRSFDRDESQNENNGQVFKRRRLCTKDCPECKICSDDVFQVCHPHISTLDMIKTKNKQPSGRRQHRGHGNVRGQREPEIFCPICFKKHSEKYSSGRERRKILMGSSTLHNLWRTDGFKRSHHNFHIDFDCIIGKTKSDQS